MRKKSIIVLITVICITSILFIEFNIYKLIKNKSESNIVLRKAYTVIENYKDEVENNNIPKGIFRKKIHYKTNQSISEHTTQDITKNRIEDTVEYTKENIVCDENIIGILVIPKLNIEAPIKEGTTQKVMETSVGHFCESDYWDGNVSFASHNSGTSAHYFANINFLCANDEIVYKTKLGTKKYKVQSVSKIKSTDWSMVIGQTKNNEKSSNTITLITCINRQPDYRLCVRGIEI